MPWPPASGITSQRSAFSAAAFARLRQRWAGGLALITGVVLLLAFHFVVRQGMEQGAARRLAATLQAEESWRCGTAQGALARSECLLGAPETRLARRGKPP